MSNPRNDIPATFWVALGLAIAALLASPRFFDMIWGRHREDSPPID